MENKIDITKLKAQDFMNELPEMVRSLEAVRSGLLLGNHRQRQ